MPSDIKHLRAAAKRLKKAFAANDAEAIARLRTIVPDKDPKHADFLHVIARENGHESWPKLKFSLEAVGMTRAERAERLTRALYFGQRWVVEKLLVDDPALPETDFGLQIATYDVRAVERNLSKSAGAATKAIGIRSPILHLAYSHYIHMAPEKRGDMLKIADLLVAGGANVNDGYPFEPGSDHEISALYGALGHGNNMALAEWLLDHGASPDDDESLYHATELGHHDGLKLLIRHGVATRGTNALPRALDFNDLEAVRLLLDHGADPNEAVTGHPSGQAVDTIPALHQAARRWCSGEIAELLLDRGADPQAKWEGHTPYATALIFGNTEIARVLKERGHDTALTETEEILAACASGTQPAVRLEASKLAAEDQHLLARVVWGPGPIDHVKALVAAGLDPNDADDMGMTPLHVAGWEGLPERVGYLLTLNPDLGHRNGYGGDALGTAIHGSEFGPDRENRDHISCARLMLEAGAELRAPHVDNCGNEAMALFLEGWNER